MSKCTTFLVNYVALGERIRQIRKDKGITVLDWPSLGCHVGVNRLMQIEQGDDKHPCTLQEIASISSALKVHSGEISDYVHPCCMEFESCQRACVILVKHLRQCLEDKNNG